MVILRKLKYFFKNQDINIINEDYEQDVKVHFEITEDKVNYIINKKEEFNFKNIIISRKRNALYLYNYINMKKVRRK